MVGEVKTTFPNEKLEEILAYFDKVADNKEKENQIIYNYHTEGELRLIKTKELLKLDFKDNQDTNKVLIAKKFEKDLDSIFSNIGLSIEFKRYRKRHKYLYKDLYITIDNNLKTGNILRIKYRYNSDTDKEKNLEMIKNLYEELGIKETTLDKFNEMYSKYRTGWADLVSDINEEEFLNED